MIRIRLPSLHSAQHTAQRTVQYRCKPPRSLLWKISATVTPRNASAGPNRALCSSHPSSRFLDSLVGWWLRMIQRLERRTQPRVLHNLTPPSPAITKIAIKRGPSLLVSDVYLQQQADFLRCEPTSSRLHHRLPKNVSRRIPSSDVYKQMPRARFLVDFLTVSGVCRDPRVDRQEGGERRGFHRLCLACQRKGGGHHGAGGMLSPGRANTSERGKLPFKVFWGERLQM